MIKVSNHRVLVCPGDILGNTNNYEPSEGCYRSDDGNIRASLVGTLHISDRIDASLQKVTVVSFRNQLASEACIEVGDKVLCRVVRISQNQANVDIVALADRKLTVHAKGVIRREDIRLAEIDKLVMHECFLPGDVIRAVVLSLGDSKQYFLSTAEVDLGVRYAKSQSGNLMNPISWKVSVCFFECYF